MLKLSTTGEQKIKALMDELTVLKITEISKWFSATYPDYLCNISYQNNINGRQLTFIIQNKYRRQDLMLKVNIPVFCFDVELSKTVLLNYMGNVVDYKDQNVQTISINDNRKFNYERLGLELNLELNLDTDELI